MKTLLTCQNCGCQSTLHHHIGWEFYCRVCGEMIVRPATGMVLVVVIAVALLAGTLWEMFVDHIF